MRIVVAASDGNNARAITRAAEDWEDTAPTWSPDGTQVAFHRSGSGIFSVPASGGHAKRLTSERRIGDDSDPAWGPDGKIAFARVNQGKWRIYLMAADGTQVTRLTSGTTNDHEPSWSPDGSRLAFAAESADRTDIYTIRPDGSDIHRITAARRDEANRQPTWSPDGTMIAYSSWGPFGNDHEIMIVKATGGVARRLTDNEGDDLEPTWGAATINVVRALARKRKPPPLSKRRPKLPGLKTWLRRGRQTGDGSACTAVPGAYAWPPSPVLTFHSHESEIEVFHGGRLEIATRGFFCGYGFSRRPSAPKVQMVLRHPHGAAEGLKEQRFVPGESGLIAYWVARPGDQGLYRVTARQGDREASTRFRVVAAENPHLLVLDKQHDSQVSQRLGRPVRILVSGIPPGGRFAIDLYRIPRGNKGGRFRYFNSVDLRADPTGTRLYNLRTKRTDRPGTYWVALRRGRRQYILDCFTMMRYVRPRPCEVP